MSVKAMGWAYDQHGLKPITKAVLVALGNIADEEGYCWPSIPRIAAMVEISARSAQRHIRDLEEQGFLTVERGRVRDTGAFTSNGYRLPLAARQLPLALHPEASDAPGDKLTPSPGDKLSGGDTAVTRQVTQLCQGDGDTAVTTYELPLEQSLEPTPKGADAPGLTAFEKKNGHTMARFFETCRYHGEQPIPEDDPVFAYAAKAKIPQEFVQLAWRVFRGKYRDSQKRYKNWRQAFRNFVEQQGYGLWTLDAQNAYVLTGKGKQAQMVHGA